MKSEKELTVFETLSAIDCNGHTETRNGLTYLSWTWAWNEVKKRYPDASYTIFRDENNKPWVEDADLGLMCYTSVTINGETIDMWLPVMDSANNTLKRVAYDKTTRSGKKHIEAADMFAVNKTLMRCLTKNIAMFGLGLYIYAGEDVPEEVKASAVEEVMGAKSFTGLDQIRKSLQERKVVVENTVIQKKMTMLASELVTSIRDAKSVQELTEIFKREPKEWWSANNPYKEMMTNKKNELKNASKNESKDKAS